MLLDLNKCFPEGPDSSQRPLPKQKLFLDAIVNPGGPDYVLYSGGVGSGKTLIGCIVTLTLAVLYPGDYLICRLFNPELKLTTMKTFFEICPPELIIENRVADQIVRIRSQGGKVSNIIFRGLEDPDKHRSMNLNAAYIDEMSQVSEEAFTLLQSRLRGKYVRKIYGTTNPNGHSWLYRYFVKKEWANPAAGRKFMAISAPSTENIHLPKGYVENMLISWTDQRIKREVMGSWDAFAGQVYTEFDRTVHVVKPFRIPDEWTKFIGADHGFRNPAAFLWLACDYDNNLYVYREFYNSEWHIDEIVKGNKRPGFEGKGIIELSGSEKIEGIWIDPSTKADRGKESDYLTYAENLPKSWSLIPANNSVSTGIDRVKQHLRLNPVSKKPQLFIFDTCVNLTEEISQYKYEELSPGQEALKNTKESPVKKNDHACFVGSTRVRTPGGDRSIGTILPGDLVQTSLGPLPVVAWSQTGVKPVYAYTFSNGAELRCTNDHPVLLADGTKKPISLLTPSDTALLYNPCKSSLTASFLEKLANTTVQTAATAGVGLRLCIEKFGKALTAQYQLATTYTTKMGILKTTLSQILSLSTVESICLSTISPPPRTAIQTLVESTLRAFGHKLKYGTHRLPATNGIGNTVSALQRRWRYKKKPRRLAKFVERFLPSSHTLLTNPSIVTRTAEPGRYVGDAPVYNISVHGASEFYAEGILVSNCDALRYAIMSRPESPKKEDAAAKRRSHNTIEASIMREMHEIRHPASKDPFKDYEYGSDHNS